ncbi:MAG: hypothetical protein RR415_13045 [Ruthenibacterium sp.]
MNIVLPLSIVAYVLFCIEVYTVRRHVAISTDTSMLWTIPLTIGALVTLLAIYTGKPSAGALQCRKWSEIIYLMQYGLIQMWMIAQNLILKDVSFILTYCLVICTALAIGVIIPKSIYKKMF